MPQKKTLKNRLHKHRTLLIAVITAVLIIALTYGVVGPKQPSFLGATSTSTIIDQLRSTYPNDTFWLAANSMFHNEGWLMYYYAGGARDNVDFYRSLPQHGFKIIVLRAHTALNPATGTLAIFTSEEWDDSKASSTYLGDFDLFNPANNKLASVRVTSNSTQYFGITPNFVKAMNGDFENAMVIMMGCDGLTNARMAEAFVEKGARAYIAWTGPVSPEHTDAATQLLLSYLINQKKTIASAVAETLKEVGNDPTYGSTILYYPTDAGEYKA